MNELRQCRTCEVPRPESDYYKDGRYPKGDIHCKFCRRNKVKQWRNLNPARAKEIQRNSYLKNPEPRRQKALLWHTENRDRHLAYMADRRKNHPEKVKSSALKNAFGISIDDYNKILNDQGGVCAICGKSPSENGKALAVDHCHHTQVVRGLLCSTCNQGIGLFKDSESLLSKAIKYLKSK